ncbi:acyltransferase [Porphyromonas pogonae]|uniref:acyltransferase n=1 Tax=Porphyromonas pogonae TaxID=867595 RepID=UPI002E788E75|nr:acyltransferase [Porphyromonas pogonae]
MADTQSENKRFESIRPLMDCEVTEAVNYLASLPVLEDTFNNLHSGYPWELLVAKAKECHTVEEFKLRISFFLVMRIAENTAFSLSLSGKSKLNSNTPYTFISNHRDIILDSAFLNVLAADAGLKIPQVAIGDNLLLDEWVKILVKLNNSFIVKRNLKGRDTLFAAKELSEYMHENIVQGNSQWIAQREGRAKDANDTTQLSLLKMLAMGGASSDFIESIKELNIVPLTCSYEYDPCDYLKVREMQYKRDNENYKKTPQEDALNMKSGVMGYKGRVHLTLSRPLNEIIDRISPKLPKQNQAEELAKLLDKEIHSNYRLYPGNYVALDLLNKTELYASHYSEEEKQFFIDYIIGQVAKIEVEEGYTKDIPFLYHKMLQMYANPAINKLRTGKAE